MLSSRGLRGPDCSAMAMKRDSTSMEAVRAAAAVWARSIGGRALVGRLLEQAATTSPIACVSSSLVRLMRSRLSRTARATACSTALGSGAMAIFCVFARNSPDSLFWEQYSGESTGTEEGCDQLLLLGGELDLTRSHLINASGG